jgi:hypothetical protein
MAVVHKTFTYKQYTEQRHETEYTEYYTHNQCFFSGGDARVRRGTHTPKHFVNLTGESKNFKMLEFPLNQLQTHYGYLCNLLRFM